VSVLWYVSFLAMGGPNGTETKKEKTRKKKQAEINGVT
jgi:hypothetical protein